jgi:hypothetical protein
MPERCMPPPPTPPPPDADAMPLALAAADAAGCMLSPIYTPTAYAASRRRQMPILHAATPRRRCRLPMAFFR